MTEENKTEYLELVCNWRMSSGIEEQTKSVLEGFNEVVPSKSQSRYFFSISEMVGKKPKFFREIDSFNFKSFSF